MASAFRRKKPPVFIQAVGIPGASGRSMHKQLIPVLLVVGAVSTLAPATASAQQTVNFSLGVFVPRGEDARVAGDVLNANRTFLVFDVGDFTSASIGGEWLVPFGQYFEGGAGISFTRQSVDSVYADFVESDGREIEQTLRLRTIPITFTVRALPLGQSHAFQPYIGAGLAVINWRYAEFGDFIDFNAANQIFTASYVADGTATGPVVVGGIRFGGQSLTAGGEIRYHAATADLPVDFAGNKIDLGGWTYNFTIGVRFGR
jgi:hypothetical protein